MKKGIAGSAVGLALLALLVVFSPWKDESSKGGFSDILRSWGNKQSEVSEEITSSAVSGAEGTVVGEHQVDGANWSIPNIIRHWLGG